MKHNSSSAFIRSRLWAWQGVSLGVIARQRNIQRDSAEAYLAEAITAGAAYAWHRAGVPRTALAAVAAAAARHLCPPARPACPVQQPSISVQRPGRSNDQQARAVSQHLEHAHPVECRLQEDMRLPGEPACLAQEATIPVHRPAHDNDQQAGAASRRSEQCPAEAGVQAQQAAQQPGDLLCAPAVARPAFVQVSSNLGCLPRLPTAGCLQTTAWLQQEQGSTAGAPLESKHPFADGNGGSSDGVALDAGMASTESEGSSVAWEAPNQDLLRQLLERGVSVKMLKEDLPEGIRYGQIRLSLAHIGRLGLLPKLLSASPYTSVQDVST